MLHMYITIIDLQISDVTLEKTDYVNIIRIDYGNLI